MHHITIRDQVCNVMASLTEPWSVPILSCRTLKRSLLADYRSCCMSFSMVESTGIVLQNAPCKCAVPVKSRSGCPPRSRLVGSSGLDVCYRIASSCHCVLTASMRNSPWSRLASGSPSPRPKAPRLLAHPFLHTSVMTLVIAVMFFSRK